MLPGSPPEPDVVHSAGERVAVITGAAGDIGAAISRRLADRGWTAVVCDQDQFAAEALADQIVQSGRRAHARHLDVTARTQMETVVHSIAERFGGIGALINNVGIRGAIEPLTSYPEGSFERVMKTNVHGVFLGLRTVLPIMIAAGAGAIVNTASTSAIRGRANLAGYVASKHAVLGLTKVAALEVLGTGVRVNAVLPGPIETHMIDAITAGMGALTNADSVEIHRAAPAPYGTIDDVAATVDYLTSADSRHLNGAGIVVDGGSTVA
jgi:NAD(P)-dependent dehydrogenase (short-subunit alcohol dehydrogenase family)